jgi:hypothetical protein
MESAYNYTVYIGIDKGDYLRTVEAKILHKFPFVKSVHVEGGTSCLQLGPTTPTFEGT